MSREVATIESTDDTNYADMVALADAIRDADYDVVEALDEGRLYVYVEGDE